MNIGGRAIAPDSPDLRTYRRAVAERWRGKGVEDRDIIGLLNAEPRVGNARAGKLEYGEKRLLVDGKTSFRLDVALTIRTAGAAFDDGRPREYRLADACYVLEGLDAMQLQDGEKVRLDAKRWRKVDAGGAKREFAWGADDGAPRTNVPGSERGRQLFQLLGRASGASKCTLECAATLRIDGAPLAHDGRLRDAGAPVAVARVAVGDLGALVAAFKNYSKRPASAEPAPKVPFALEFKYGGNKILGADGTDTIAATVAARFFIEDKRVSFLTSVQSAEIRFGGIGRFRLTPDAPEALEARVPRGPRAPPRDTALTMRGPAPRPARGRAERERDREEEEWSEEGRGEGKEEEEEEEEEEWAASGGARRSGGDRDGPPPLSRRSSSAASSAPRRR